MRNKLKLIYLTAKNGNNKVMTGRKRIKRMSDSSDDDGDVKQNGLSILEKEARLKTAKQRVPGLDAMIIQDALFQRGWDVESAVEYLIKTNGSTITLPVNKTIYKSADVPVSAANVKPTLINSSVKTTSMSSVQRLPKKV